MSLRKALFTLLVVGAAGIAVMVAVVIARTLLASEPSAVLQVKESPVQIDVGQAAAHLSAAVRFQTITSDDPDATPTEALTAQREWLTQTYPRLHQTLHREVVGEGALVYEWTGTRPDLAPVVLMAHQDVVPAQDSDRWRYSPFSGAIADGAVWGRGSIDDKGTLVAIMEVVETLVSHRFQPLRTIYIVSGYDEERNGRGARAAAAYLKQRGVKALFVLDEGSLVVRDHPVTHAPVALIGIAEKGYVTLRVTARSPGGHSSAPPDETAVGTLSRAVVAITSRPFPKRYQGVTQAMLNALAPRSPFLTRMAVANSWLFEPVLVSQIGASAPGAAMLHTTIAPTMLSGSPKDNILSSTAIAKINYRVAPEDNADDVLKRARAAVGALPVDIQFDQEPTEPSPVSDSNSAAYRLVAGSAMTTFGAPAAPAIVIAATDSRFMRSVSDRIYRFQPIELSLAETDMIHGIDEHITLKQLAGMTQYLATLIQGLQDPSLK